MVETLKKEFEKIIIELGFSFNSSHVGFYILRDENGTFHPITVRLIESKSPNTKIHGSKNGNKIQVIGLFKFKRIKTAPEPDFLIFTFLNPFKTSPEYLIIPEEEFKKRFLNKNLRNRFNKRAEIIFWLMPDGSIFETTHISPEGEWYYLSKGIDGRMADGTDMDYTMFLNIWQRLMPKLPDSSHSLNN
jgi:hypothetical protein